MPLAQKALQVILVGPAGDEAKVSADLQALLASLDGPSSWHSDEERILQLVYVVSMVVGALGGAWWWRRRSPCCA